MEELRNKIIATENAIQTINDLINENIRDIDDDKTSDYSKFLTGQNKNLLYAKQLLEDTLETYRYTD